MGGETVSNEGEELVFVSLNLNVYALCTLMYDLNYSQVIDELLSLMANDESILPLLAESSRPRVIIRPIDRANATRTNAPTRAIVLLLGVASSTEVDGVVLFSISIQPLASSVMGMVVLMLTT
jgi:hypothetical protein